MEHVISSERNYTMDITPMVTIVLPCYNYAKYLSGAVSSIAKQTYRDFDVIIVNDGSTDNTLEVARELLEKYRSRLNITLIDQENQGHPSATRNTGYSFAKGKYYFALDADDMIKPEYVTRAIEMFEKYPDVDIVYPGYQAFGGSDWFHIPPDFDFDSLKYWDYIPYSAVLRREVYERVGGYDTSPSLRIMEDWDFWLRAYREGFKFKPIKEALLLYRTHRRSLHTSQKNWPSFAASIRLNNLSLFDEFDIEWARRILDSAEIKPYEGKKILFIVDHFPPDVGGAEKFAMELGIEFARLGFLVDVATLSLNRGFYYCNGLNIFEFEYEVGPYVPDEKPEFDKLREFVEKGDYDLILIKGGIRNWAIWSLDEPEKYPTVFVPMINKESVGFLNVDEKARKKLVERLKSAKSVISLTKSGHDAEFYRENDIPFNVIPNAVNFVSPTVDFRKEMGIPSDTKVLLCIASYYEVKNQLWLVESLRHVPGNWVLVTMGRVMNQDYYHQILSEVRDDGRFLVLHQQSKGIVAAAMEQADLLLLPSQAEVFGRVVLEAMSHRLPWIASTNCAGLKEVKGGNLAQLECKVDEGAAALSTKRGEAVQGARALQSPFVKELRSLLSDPTERERLGEEGYRQWKDSYQWNDFVGRYLDAAGLEPDPGCAVDLRRNTMDTEPAMPEYIELVRSEKRERPLVSVILITCERPEQLKTAIRSVLDQIYENFEVMVVNDGGMDVSGIIKEFDDERIIYRRNKENLGPAASRNAAISKARGKYIAYLDDDDIYYPTHLETLVDALEFSEEPVAYTDAYFVTMVWESGQWHRKSKDLRYSEDFTRDTLFASNIVPINCVMHDAKLFVEVEGFDESLWLLEDWDLWIRMAQRCDFRHIKEITCEVSSRADKSHMINARIDDLPLVTRTINDKYDGLVYRARDKVNKNMLALLARFEIMRNFSVTDALKQLENALDDYAENPRLEYICAQIYRGEGDREKAKEHLESCLKLDPGHKLARKDLVEVDQELVETGGKASSIAQLPDAEIEQMPEREPSEERGRIPIVVPVSHREDDTRAMFKQLDTVTCNYSLIIVNDGFDDPDFLKGLDPRYYIENTVEEGIVHSINKGIELLNADYIAVLRSDVLINEVGWLDNVVHFMRQRPDVGLVGLSGRHSITEKGIPDLMTPVSNLRGHPDSYKPTLRFTEVIAIDDAGWVMRNLGFQLSEDCGDTSLHAVDLSLKYIEAGFRVYVAAIEYAYTKDREDSARRFAIALTDEAYVINRIKELEKVAQHVRNLEAGIAARDEVQNAAAQYARNLEAGIAEATQYVRKVEGDWQDRVEELEKVAQHVRDLEADIVAKDDALANIIEHEAQLERALSARTTTRLKNFMTRRTRKNPPLQP